MAIRRTKHDKQKASFKRQTQTYSWEANAGTASQKRQPARQSGSEGVLPRFKSDLEITTDAEKVIGYPASFIYQDLAKTVVMTLLVISGLVALRVYLQ